MGRFPGTTPDNYETVHFGALWFVDRDPRRLFECVAGRAGELPFGFDEEPNCAEADLDVDLSGGHPISATMTWHCYTIGK